MCGLAPTHGGFPLSAVRPVGCRAVHDGGRSFVRALSGVNFLREKPPRWAVTGPEAKPVRMR